MVLTVPEGMLHPIGNLHLQTRDLLQVSRLWQNTAPGLSEKVATFSDRHIVTQHSIFMSMCVRVYLRMHVYRSCSLSHNHMLTAE